MKRLFAIILSVILSAFILCSFSGCDFALVDEETSTEECSVIDEEESSASIADDFSKNVVIDTQDFTFFVENAERNETTNTWSVKVYMENKTNKPITFSWKEVFVNGCSIDPAWTYEVKAGEKDSTTVSFDMAIFAENEIDTVENLQFTLSVYDEKENILEDTEYLFSLNVSAEETTVIEETIS